MLFFKIEAFLKNSETIPESCDRNTIRTMATEFSIKSESFFQRNDQKYYLFTIGGKDNKMTFGAITKEANCIEKIFWKYAKNLPVQVEKIEIEEITFKGITALLTNADRNGFITDDEDILEAFEVDCISGRYNHVDYGESLLSNTIAKDKLISITDNLLLTETLKPEIERIYMGCSKTKVQGHPVHYIVQTDDSEVCKNICSTLLEALYDNGRIQSKRYCFVYYDEESYRPDSTYDALYRSCENGTVIVHYNSENCDGGRYARNGEDVIASLCETAIKYKNKVLTVICVPSECTKTKETFLANLGSTSFIELYEDVVFGERADAYLKNIAKKYNIRPDKRLIPVTCDSEKGFRSTELNIIFDEWYNKKLRNSIYPQYKETETVKRKIVKEKPKGSAYSRLQTLIGLTEAKKVMNQALNFYKAQKVFADRGMTVDRPSMHMVFTGNPGTAKTTVARLFAQIMQENGLLSNGNLYEVGRADLVGKYVGHTAPLVKQAFQKAKGSVLFIDEAYSLVDDKDGLFGDEAINTIVQEMENHREDTIVIFAGYPDKMEGFLNKNPGLRSRIAFFIPFEDYVTEELCSIAELIAKEKGLELSEDAISKLGNIFETARNHNDFGNGRFARNMIEKAKMAQANRLITMDFDSVTDHDIVTIRAEDIEEPLLHKPETEHRRIGFC